MKEIEEILEIGNDQMKIGLDMIDQIGKSFSMGMTRYECRFGTVSDGHEVISRAHIYFRANREFYNRSGELFRRKAMAKKLNAKRKKIISELELIKKASTPDYEIEDKEADLELITQEIITMLAGVKDLHREMDEFNKIRMELKEEVERQYPGGIEQAQKDIWTAVAEYRATKKNIGYTEHLTHVPLDPYTKAGIGIKHASPEMTLWLQELEKEALSALGGDVHKLLELRSEQLKLIDQKNNRGSNT